MRIARQAVLVSAVVPDASFAEKIEPRAMHHFGVRDADPAAGLLVRQPDWATNDWKPRTRSSPHDTE
jgi:hypothetical protein